jgi:cytochrome c-type biogenesis protein CcmF
MFDRYTVPLALMLVLLSGIGPVIAWRRATASNLRRNLLKPALGALAVLVGLSALGLAREWRALAMFGFAAFVLGALGQELWRGVRARRAMAGGSVPGALVALVRRNRRRYGGYLVHAGVAVLFVGVAASSSFQDERELVLSKGDTTTVGAYEVTYVKPTAALVAAPNGRLERIDLGAVLRLRRDGGPATTMRTGKSFFPSTAPALGPVSRFFEGEATTEVGLRAGVRRDVWTAVAPDIDRLRKRIEEGDRVFAAAEDELGPEQRDAFLGQALAGLVRSYAADAPPATFRLIVSPLVTWIWVGALLAIAGGLIALWPTPRGATRLARAAYAARVGREVRTAGTRA